MIEFGNPTSKETKACNALGSMHVLPSKDFGFIYIRKYVYNHSNNNINDDNE